MNAHHDSELYERIYQIVLQIPHGQVATYGDIATIIGGGVDARTVGYALGALSKARMHEVPWQRVIARDGTISTRGSSQQQQLEAEGVSFDAAGRVVMVRHTWAAP